MSNRYREALAHLTFGVREGGGFVLLTGEVGTGKTTVCRCLLQQLPKSTRLAFILNPKLNSVELLATICDELQIEYPENCTSLKLLTDRLSEYLLDAYRNKLNVVVMIDEAQNLKTEVLEQIRLLTNLETNQKKLMQIILVGQPELQEKLVKRELRQLAQRITARYHLRPLQLKETIAYILHRMRIAGSTKALFSRDAVKYLHAKTQGIPRLINTICDRALFAASVRKKHRVDKFIMIQAVNEIMGQPEKIEAKVKQQARNETWKSPLLIVLIVLAVGIIGGLSYWAGHSTQANPSVNQSVSSPIDASITTATANAESTQQNLLKKLTGDQRWDYNGQFSFESLLGLWQVNYYPLQDGDACAFAATYGLRCFKGNANWQKLREYNRPVLLKFSAGLQGQFWGLLKSIKGMDGVMVVGNKQTQLGLDELSNIWTGEFVFVWQMPEAYVGDIKMGDSGKIVTWLSSMISQLNGDQVAPQDFFDASLQQRLMDFQRLRNINADGIAGMQTILKINAEFLIGIPLLTGIK